MKRLTRRLARASGWQVIEPTGFYSPIPELERLSPDLFDRRSELAGIELDTAAQIVFAETQLAGYLGEFGEGPEGFPIRNAYYETGDAEIAYAWIRHLKPRRVLELGSGYSTIAIGHALERNRAEGHESRYLAANPYPPQHLRGGTPGLDEQRALPAQEVPLEEFDALGSGDVLFVDTSHTVKLGGDVNRVVLDILPLLEVGVHVHFHDIWLPYEYHPTLVREMGLFWNEQYLVQAFLSLNRAYEIVFATRAVAVAEAARLERLIPLYDGTPYPTSFWIRRVEWAPKP